MNGPDADIISECIAMHLRKNRFAQCLTAIKAAQEKHDRGTAINVDRIAIAELELSLRWVNKLEEAGYIYVDDMDGVDMSILPTESQVGPGAIQEITQALKKGREEQARRKEAKRLEQAKKEESWLGNDLDVKDSKRGVKV